MKLFNSILCGVSLLVAVACGGATAEENKCEGGGKCATECTKKECMDKSDCKSVAVIENIMSRRSVRNYKQQAVPRDVLEQIMECGVNAPNGQNKQSWEVRVVENSELQNEIKALMATVGGERAAGCFYNAPVWVFIARDKGYDFSAYDCGLMAENMMLSANALGVASVCLGSPVRYILMAEGNEQVLSKLGFSEGYELSLCLSMGYPDGEKPEAKPRDLGKVKYID